MFFVESFFPYDRHHRENQNRVSGTICIIDFMCPKEAEIKTRWKVACHFKCKIWQEKYQVIPGLPNCVAMLLWGIKSNEVKFTRIITHTSMEGKESVTWQTHTYYYKKLSKEKIFPSSYLLSTNKKVSWKYELDVLCNNFYHLGIKLNTTSTATLNTPIA